MLIKWGQNDNPKKSRKADPKAGEGGAGQRL